MGKVHEYKLRARYSEIDGMKFVHNAVYPIYFEEARTDLVRQNNYPYEKLESMGLIMPLSQTKVDYKASIYYDEEFIVKVSVKQLKTFSVKFYYEICKEDGTLAATGHTLHACVDAKAGDFAEFPDDFREVFEKYLI